MGYSLVYNPSLKLLFVMYNKPFQFVTPIPIAKEKRGERWMERCDGGKKGGREGGRERSAI